MQFSPQGGNGTVFALNGNQIEAREAGSIWKKRFQTKLRAQRSGSQFKRKKELT